jgi:RHS repeat-associated protein
MRGRASREGNGKRVKKYVPSTGEVSIFVYDAGGKLIAEYSTEISQDPKVSFTTSDHLGSPRIKTDENGAVISRNDYHPYGEDLFTAERTQALGYKPDDIRQKFTSYEKDEETDLDFAQARMYSNKIGRFVSPDPISISAKRIKNPQIWNRYSYTGNNPLSFTDPDGLERIALGESEDEIKKKLEEEKKKRDSIKKDKTLSKDGRNERLKEQDKVINRLNIQLRGTQVVNSILERMNKRKENPNGLELSDFELTTDPRQDFAGHSNLTQIMESEAFTDGNKVFIRTDLKRGFFQQSTTDSDYYLIGAAIIAHEDYHIRNPSAEHIRAYEHELKVLQKFQHDFRNSSTFNQAEKNLKELIERLKRQ